MLSIANEVDPLIFHYVCFVCDTNMYFSNTKHMPWDISSWKGQILRSHGRDVLICPPSQILPTTIKAPKVLA